MICIGPPSAGLATGLWDSQASDESAKAPSAVVGEKATATKAGAPNTAEDVCHIYKVSEAAKIIATCPIVSENDFLDARRVCLEQKKNQSPDCQLAQSQIRSRLSELKSKYETEAYKQHETSGELFSGSYVPPLGGLYQETDHVLSQINDLMVGSRCDLSSTANALLPFVAYLAPTPAYAIAASSALIQKTISILKEKKMTIASKLALCEANRIFRSSRSEACTDLREQSPKYASEVKMYLRAHDQVLERGRKTKAYQAAQAFKGLAKSLDEMVQAGDRSTSVAAKEGLARVNDLNKLLDCKRAENAKLCDALKFAQQTLQGGLLADPTADTATRAEALKKLTRIKDDFNSEFVTVGGWARIVQPAMLTNESKMEIAEGIIASNSDSQPDWDPARQIQKQLSNHSTNEHAIELMKDAFSKLPPKLASNAPTEKLCEATACIWGAAKARSQSPGFAQPEPAPNSWTPFGKQTFSTYVEAGKTTYLGWAEVASPYKGVLSSLVEKCSKSPTVCEVSCEAVSPELTDQATRTWSYYEDPDYIQFRKSEAAKSAK